MTPTTDLFMVTYSRDFPYLRYMLRSVARFCRGFSYMRILVPHEDVDETLRLVSGSGIRFTPVMVVGYEEKPGKGFLWHERQIMRADEFTDGEVICHIDPDVVFTEEVWPKDLFHDGKIVLRYEPYESICRRHEGIRRWQECTQRCLPFSVPNECMRAFPLPWWRSTYKLAREAVERKVCQPIDDYILSCENSFPQTFAEHNTLGSVAMELEPDKYHCVRQTSDKPEPDNKLRQWWSHGSIDQPQNVWYKGKQELETPSKWMDQLLGPSRYEPSAEEDERMSL